MLIHLFEAARLAVTPHRGCRTRGSRRLAACALCALLMSATARAQAEDATDPKIEAEYQQLITDALAEYDRGSWEESAALFRRAHELRPSARTLRGLGLAAYEARRYPDSIRYLSEALSDTRRPLTPKQRDEVGATLGRARLFVGYLRLDVEPATATVLVNGQTPQPDAAGELTTDVGWLDLEVRADGYETLNKRVRMNAGDHQKLHLRLVTTAPPPTAAGVSREREPNLPAPEQPATSQAASESSSLSTWKWVSSAAAVAALGAGATMLIMQKTQASDYTAECVNMTTTAASCERREKLLGGTLWTGSIVGLSVGAGLTALSVVLFVLDAQPGKSERASGFAGCTGQGTVGAACQFRF